MLVPTTQEEIDRRENLSNKVQLTSDIMNMLSDIEDPQAKLRILKSLLSNVIDDNDILSIIQEQIDELEETGTEEFSETTETEIEEPSPSGKRDFNDTFGSELAGEAPEETETGETSEEETILPSPEELGVDLNNTEEL